MTNPSADPPPSLQGSVEILCVGTELLLGNILNGNARWLAERLAALGLPHHRQGVVGDNRDRLIAAVREAAQRCRVLVITGGLGPTPDDLTTEAIAAAFDAELVEHAGVWADIQAKLQQRGRSAEASLRRQALLPRGAGLLPNPTGTAPGMIWTPRPGFTVLTFPGVPSEMKAMWEATAAPWLRASGLARGVFASRMLHFWGMSESGLAERVADLLALQNPTVAPYAGAGEVRLRITACAADALAATALLAPVEAELRARTGRCCFGVDGQSLAAVVLERLEQRGETVAVAESCTGGGIGAALAAVPGASQTFLGGVIAYANSVKQGLLAVPEALLREQGAVSDAVVLAMAEGARRCTGATWAVAVSGIAGPTGGSAEKPVGLVHIAVAGPNGAQAEPVRFGAQRGREWIQTLAVGEALNRLRLRLTDPA
ncbi:MAG: competence/damage-inducible protein A [Synechococcaceae cyanobacterium]|nr:competence/damage-inducible protein A [Synechococcaceae cyanobacterium]